MTRRSSLPQRGRRAGRGARPLFRAAVPSPVPAAACAVALALTGGVGGAAAQTVLPPVEEPGVCGQPRALTHILTGLAFDGTQRVTLPLALDRHEVQYLEFRLGAATGVALTAAGQDGADPFLTLYDVFGEVIATDDDGGGGFDSRIAQRVEAGAYCLQVRLLDQRGAGAVVLALEAGEPGVLPPAGEDTAAVAGPGACTDPALTEALGPLGDGLTVSGRLDPGARRDFRFDSDPDTPLRATLRSADFDTTLSLSETGGDWIDENDDGPDMGTDSLLETYLPGGDLCLSVGSFGGGGGGEFDLALEVVADGFPALGGSPDRPVCTDPANTADLGAALAPGSGPVRMSGSLDGVPETYVRAQLDAAMQLRLDLSSAVFDTVLTVYDADGGVRDTNDDGPDTGTDSQLTLALEPGTHCLGVSSFGGGGGAFALVAVPAGADPAANGPAGPPADPGAVEALGLLDGQLRTRTVSAEETLWASFEVPEPGRRVQIDATSISGPFTLHLLSADGDALQREGSSGTVNAARIETELAPGGYLLAQTSDRVTGSTILRQMILTPR